MMRFKFIQSTLNNLLRIINKTIKEDWIVFVFIITTWFKLIYLDRIIFDWPLLGVFLIFTFASSVLVFSPVLIFKKAKPFLVLGLSTIIALILWANTIYYRFFGSLIKLETLAITRQTTGVTDSIYALMRSTDIIYFFDILVIIIFLGFLKYKPAYVKSIRERVLTFFIFLFVSVLTISLILYADRAEHLEKFIFRNFDINEIERRYGLLGVHGINSYRFLFISNRKINPEREREVVNWVKANKVGQNDNSLTGVAKDKNIFIIQLESVQSSVVGKKFENQEITPNLNRLISEATYFPNGGYIIGGGRTSDSDFVANTSLYPLPEASVFVQHGRHDFTSLPKALEKAGYSSYAYHGFTRDFWNRGLAFNSLGYDKFYAADNYKEGTNIIMGLSDKDFYLQTLEKIKTKRGPNLHYLISLTSHYPFDMALEHQLLKGDLENYDYRTFHYYQAVHYADNALGLFIDGLKREGLYDESLIIIYGDHSARVGELNNSKTLKTLGIDSVSDEALYNLQKIPFIVKLPGQKEPSQKEEAISQIDLMPTILNLAGVKTEFPMFGRDVFNSNASRYFSVVNELSKLSVFNGYVYFISPLVEGGEALCYSKVSNFLRQPLAKCQELLEAATLEQGFSWDLTKYNLFNYFY